MTDTTATEFDPALESLARLAKALAHPGRLRILNILKDGGCICGDIVDRMPLAQATVSQHLKELKKVGLIRGEIAGPRVCYCLDPAAVKRARQDLVDWFDGMATGQAERDRHEKG